MIEEYVLMSMGKVYICYINEIISYTSDVKWALKFFNPEDAQEFHERYDILEIFDVVKL